MKLIFTRTMIRHAIILVLLTNFVIIKKTGAQICSSPGTIIYGLTGTGAIYPITVSTATVGSAVKNTTYSGNSASKANGLAYNSTNGKFYYFKRNVGVSPQEFVSYDPATATVSVLATSTCAAEVHTGCITADGLYYYTIDVNANMNCYNIVTNTWTYITSSITDQFGNNVSTVIQNQNAGDIAFDGNGNLWVVTSSSTNWGVYSIAGPLPTTPVAGLTANRRVNPTTATPSGNSIAGIAFNPSGQIFMATKNDNRLYRLENNLSLTWMGTFGVSDVGNDLTSCAFPFAVLPITWIHFDAKSAKDNEVAVEWKIGEKPYSGFYVQRSPDGKTWKDIAFIKIEVTDVEGKMYQYTDRNPQAGENYYRIKTNNENNRESFSPIKVVSINSVVRSHVNIWPNPASDQLSIESENAGARRVSIYDLAGRMHMDKQFTNAQNNLNISSLKPGAYLVTIQLADGRTENKKLIKQ